MKKILILLLLISSLFACTEEERAKNYGGNFTLKLAPNEELINITWKKDDLWYLVKNTKTGNLTFKEHSSYGMWEGTVKIKPNKVKPVVNKWAWEK